MDNNVKLIESLLESIFKYGEAELELLKLKTLSKTSDVISNLIPLLVVFFILFLFLLFFSLGLAYWMGEIIGNPFCGFFMIAALYAIVGLVIHFFMHKQIKRKISNYLVKQMFK